MHAHAGSHRKQPALPAFRRAAGNSAQGHRAGTAAQNPMRGGLRILGNLQVLRHHVAGAKGNDAQRHGGAGDSLDDIKDGAVAAADNDGIVAFRHGPLRLWSRGAVFARLQDVDRGARLAKDMRRREQYLCALLAVC